MTRPTLAPAPLPQLPHAVRSRQVPRPTKAAAGRHDGLSQRVNDGLWWLLRGSEQVAAVTGVAGMGPASLLPGGPEVAGTTMAWATATAMAAAVALGWQRELAPGVHARVGTRYGGRRHLHADAYDMCERLVARALRTWERGNRERGLHLFLGALASVGSHDVVAACLDGFDLSGMAAYALQQQRWSAVDRLLLGVPRGHRVFWDAIVAASRTGAAQGVPLMAWSRRLLDTREAAISADEAVQLTDILVASQEVPPAREGAIRPAGLLDCVGQSQRGELDPAVRHHLVRLLMEAPVLNSAATCAAIFPAGPLRDALLALDESSRHGRLDAGQRLEAFALFDSVVRLGKADATFVHEVQALAAGSKTLRSFARAAAERDERSEAACNALASSVLTQWIGGDPEGATSSAKKLLASKHPFYQRTMKRVFARAPRAFGQLLLWAAHARDSRALTALLPVSEAAAPAVRLAVLDALCSAEGDAVDIRPLFQGVDALRLRDLSVERLQRVLPVLLGCWYLPHEEALALQMLVRAWREPFPPEILRVWLEAARTPELTRVFEQLARSPRALGHLREKLVPALAQGYLSNRGFLVGMHLLQAVPGLNLDHPRVVALLRCGHLLKNVRRTRELLSALAQLGALEKKALSAPARQILAWPSDEQLRTLLRDRCMHARRAQREALTALQLGVGDQATARAARDEVELYSQNMHLVADHLFDQGDRAGIQIFRECLRADAGAQREHLRRLGSLLPDDSEGRVHVHALLVAESLLHMDKETKALNVWRKGLAKGAAAELGAQVQAAAVWLTRRDRMLVHVRKPLPPPAVTPTNFFVAFADHGAAQTLQNQLVALQVEALHDLLAIEAFGGHSAACETPQHAALEKGRLLGMSAVKQANFDAMLQSFRDRRLFWAFAARMRRHSAAHRAGFETTLRHLLQGTHTEQRRESPQMRALFGCGRRAALREAWEAGAWSSGPSHPAYRGLRLHDTGAFEDFASSGDEIPGSCHSLMSGSYWHFLMGRVVCGSKRMLTLKDERGRMVARAVFRLMLDRHNEPVLLLSRCYAKESRGSADSVLRDFAVKRAQALGLPLVSRTGSHKGGIQVHCKTGEFPEYWDEGLTMGSLVASVLWRPAQEEAA